MSNPTSAMSTPIITTGAGTSASSLPVTSSLHPPMGFGAITSQAKDSAPGSSLAEVYMMKRLQKDKMKRMEILQTSSSSSINASSDNSKVAPPPPHPAETKTTAQAGCFSGMFNKINPTIG